LQLSHIEWPSSWGTTISHTFMYTIENRHYLTLDYRSDARCVWRLCSFKFDLAMPESDSVWDPRWQGSHDRRWFDVSIESQFHDQPTVLLRTLLRHMGKLCVK